MIYTPLTIKAMKIAYEHHMGQTDKAGLPYVLHPLHLAEQMQDEDTTVVALLHDIVEDTDVTFTDLLRVGFTFKQVQAVGSMTHEKGKDYMEYIENQILPNPIARKVKLADLEHNMDLTRLHGASEKDCKRVEEKYIPAYRMIRDYEDMIKI